VDRLARSVAARRFHAARIHGDLEQVYRDKALLDFRTGACRILIATDIAARGLDVTGIEHVINFDFPHQAEDYVHRIGRTARVDASGLASSFVTRGDRRFVAGVRELIGDKLPQPIRLDSYNDAPTHGDAGHGGHGGGGHGGGDSRKGRPGRSGGGSRQVRSGGQSRQAAHNTQAGHGSHVSQTSHAGHHSSPGHVGHVAQAELTGGADEQVQIDLAAQVGAAVPTGDAGAKKRRRRRGGRSGSKNQGNQPAGNPAANNQPATQDLMPD
jgi:ATP-dependent RNA helicase RhlE